jgi:hypothetical protein
MRLGRRASGQALARRDAARIIAIAIAGAAVAPTFLAWGLSRADATAGSLVLNLEAVLTVLLACVMYREIGCPYDLSLIGHSWSEDADMEERRLHHRSPGNGSAASGSGAATRSSLTEQLTQSQRDDSRTTTLIPTGPVIVHLTAATSARKLIAGGVCPSLPLSRPFRQAVRPKGKQSGLQREIDGDHMIHATILLTGGSQCDQ